MATYQGLIDAWATSTGLYHDTVLAVFIVLMILSFLSFLLIGFLLVDQGSRWNYRRAVAKLHKEIQALESQQTHRSQPRLLAPPVRPPTPRILSQQRDGHRYSGARPQISLQRQPYEGAGDEYELRPMPHSNRRVHSSQPPRVRVREEFDDVDIRN
ncbi:hypothetical protein F5Y04DRAFT_244500 [Hypomontagnella monticulosa]|nr:hypothetical protein F5Y04DRAFT_244500 [Hypomontagnella monticulosa]